MEDIVRKVTGEEVKNSMIENDINTVDHHKCSICKYMTKYVREDNQIFFDSGCFCTKTPNNLRTEYWDNVAHWINMQSNQEIKNKLAQKFGIKG